MGCLVQVELYMVIDKVELDKCYASYSVLKYRANISLENNDLELCFDSSV